MEHLTIAICDDDPAFRAVMRSSIEAAFYRCGTDVFVAEASSAAVLDNLMRHMAFDLIFLDIDMPELDGIRFGEQLRSRGILTDILYVSNMEERVYDIFRVHPWSFIRKRRFADEIGAAAEEYVCARRKQAEPILLQTTDGKTLPIHPAALLYVEAAGKQQKLFMEDRADPVSVRTSLRELEEMLLPHGFIRIHKGFLVNYRIIKRITSRSVLLDNGTDLPVGRDRLAAARERYLSLMKWKGLSRTT